MKISIFTSSYNYGKYLRQAIESVLCQTYTDWEYILIDYGSTDNSYDIMKEYAIDTRIKPIQIGAQRNTAIVINKSIKMATGDYWSWCPADDYWAHDLLEIKIKHIPQYPLSVLYHNFYIIDETGNLIGQSNIKEMTEEQFNEEVWVSSPIGFTGIFIPMYIFRDINLYFPEHLEYSEDFYWMINATIHGIPFNKTSGVLHYKRKHINAVTSQKIEQIIKNVPIIRDELKKKYDT